MAVPDFSPSHAGFGLSSPNDSVFANKSVVASAHTVEISASDLDKTDAADPEASSGRALLLPRPPPPPPPPWLPRKNIRLSAFKDPISR